MLLVLFTVALLASVAAVASSAARRSTALTENRRAQTTARAMAESGVLAARVRIESALRRVADDTVQRDAVLAALTAIPYGPAATPWLEDSLGNGAYAVTVVDLTAQLDVNTTDAEGLARLLATVAPSGEAARIAEAIADRVRGTDPQTGTVRRSLQPFASLEELLTVPGFRVQWLEQLAADLTVDGDGRINRRAASPRVLASATGTLVDRPTRVLLLTRGWQRGHPLTREIAAVYAIEGSELRLVRWRERDV